MCKNMSQHVLGISFLKKLFDEKLRNIRHCLHYVHPRRNLLSKRDEFIKIFIVTLTGKN